MISATNHAILEEVLQQRIDPSHPCTIPPEWLNALMDECIHRGMVKANKDLQGRVDNAYSQGRESGNTEVSSRYNRPGSGAYNDGGYAVGLAVGMCIGDGS